MEASILKLVFLQVYGMIGSRPVETQRMDPLNLVLAETNGVFQAVRREKFPHIIAWHWFTYGHLNEVPLRPFSSPGPGNAVWGTLACGRLPKRYGSP